MAAIRVLIAEMACFNSVISTAAEKLAGSWRPHVVLTWGLSLEENSELSQVTLWKLKALTLAPNVSTVMLHQFIWFVFERSYYC